MKNLYDPSMVTTAILIVIYELQKIMKQYPWMLDRNSSVVLDRYFLFQKYNFYSVITWITRKLNQSLNLTNDDIIFNVYNFFWKKYFYINMYSFNYDNTTACRDYSGINYDEIIIFLLLFLHWFLHLFILIGHSALGTYIFSDNLHYTNFQLNS